MRDFEKITERLDYSHRGGGIEIALDTIDNGKYEGGLMTAYQNYLGGGMLGRIMNDCTIQNWRDDSKLVGLANELSEYFHSLTNHSDDEFESTTFLENQIRPSSSY